MELDFDKLISWKNADKAVVGNRYYYFYKIIPEDLNNVDNNPVGILDRKHDIYKMNPFVVGTDSVPFLYPYEEEKRYITYEELKERWIKNPTELYRYGNSTGMITTVEDEKKTVYLCQFILSDSPKYEDDKFLIRNITDINGNPLIKE